ncbi:PAS domain S-box-containing protein [Rhodovulum bhavnagarense]|uniref:histidine kinase n=1 Tax=Rhodovulum bhavnagarense TaxID=992286 RepID=A0A4R2R6F5_9RHOB|nr:PAS domain S-box protein [Rhodovulum bhavnagarense]TCP58622.1 PAS domain S-box-containing protein [Rhodovulum bhavnagarense]
MSNERETEGCIGHVGASDHVLPGLSEGSAYKRVTDAQIRITRVFDTLLRADNDHADRAIDQALADIGSFFVSDRSYLFQLRNGNLLDNTHEWCADGIEPMIGMLQGVPIDIAAHWFDRFNAGHAVHIPDVPGMPDDSPEKETLMMQGIKSLLVLPTGSEGVFTGFVGLDMVQDYREFLPGEIALLQSTAHAMQALLQRRAAAWRVQEAQHSVRSERNRLRATLDAIPDLVLELDDTGRFTSFHTGDDDLRILPPDQVIGHTIEEALPNETATIVRDIFDRTVQGNIVRQADIPLETPLGTRFFSVAAAASPAEPDTARHHIVASVRDTTEERARERRSEQLARIVEEMEETVILADTDGLVTYVNPAFEKQTGYRLDDVRGKAPGSFLRGEQTEPQAAEAIDYAIRTHQSLTIETRNFRKDGTPYWTEMRLQPVHDASGTFTGFLSVQTDISERKEYAEKLAQRSHELALAQERLQGAVEVLPQAFAYYDADDRLVLCNERYRACYPKSAPMIEPGRRFEEIMRYGLERGEYANVEGREEEWAAERLRRHRMDDHTSEQLLADGRWIQVIERRTPDGGQVGLRIDITDLKRSVQRAEKERLAAMDASRDGMGITDAGGKVLYLNRAFAGMLGLASDNDCIGQDWSVLYPPEVAEFLATTAIPETRRQGSWQGEVMAQRRDEGVFPVELSLTLRDDGGILCIARDVTQRKRASMEQARLREQLQIAQRREIISQFSRGIAHDFNNLLAVIAGAADMLNEGIAIEKNAERILAASQSGKDLIARFFNQDRNTAKRITLDLRKSVREACDLLQVSLGPDIDLHLDLPQNPVITQADPTDVLQVVLNLGVNARDAILASPRKNDRRITVELAMAGPQDLGLQPRIGYLQEARSYCMIRVRDTGIGIPAESQDRIFTPSYTTKAQDGSGLGLTIVTSAARSYGGAISLDSTVGKGTAFTFFWPVGSTETSRPRSAKTGEGTSASLEGRTILAVDDNEDVLMVVGEYLERSGASVACCSDPQDAIEALQDDPDAWDLVVTDFDMPGMNGAELAQAAHRLAPDVPVILLTAVPDWNENSEKSTETLFTIVLGKPIMQADLIAACKQAMGKPS